METNPISYLKIHLTYITCIHFTYYLSTLGIYIAYDVSFAWADVPCKITIMIYFGTSGQLYVITDFWILRTINRTHLKSIFFHLYGLLWYFLGPMNKDQELIYEYQYLFFHQNDQDRFYSPYPKIEKCVDKMCDHCTYFFWVVRLGFLFCFVRGK